MLSFRELRTSHLKLVLLLIQAHYYHDGKVLTVDIGDVHLVPVLTPELPPASKLCKKPAHSEYILHSDRACLVLLETPQGPIVSSMPKSEVCSTK